MNRAARPCTIALDLGTSAFKAAWVDDAGRVGPVAVAKYQIDCNGLRVTCPPERYLRAALRALRQAGAIAAAHDLSPQAIGITSQAQTFVTLNEHSKPMGPAIVWLDSNSEAESEDAAGALPDFCETSGFTRPSPLQFLSKVMRVRRSGCGGSRYLLLNEWLIQWLTGEAFGDTNSQGMGGFWDVGSGSWNQRALDLAGITPENLGLIGPAGALSAPLSKRAQRSLGLPTIPVYSCGNDQGCAAIGAGLENPGDLFCNFGTALVVYGLTAHNLGPANDNQIAGVAPIPNRWFLLGVESECGKILEGLARRFAPRGGIGRMIEEALAVGPDIENLPSVNVRQGQMDLTGISARGDRAAVVRAVLVTYSERFGALLSDVSRALGKPERIFAGGGLSQSRALLDLLERRHGITLRTCDTEHTGLRGVARVIEKGSGSERGTPV